MPSQWVLDGRMATEFTWGGQGPACRSAGIAALQLWVCLITQAEEHHVEDGSKPILVAELTYTTLMEATGLSKALVSSGLGALKGINLINSETIGRANRYTILEYDGERDWCKLPARALYSPFYLSNRRIAPFQVFQKRSVCELDAMKMYLYFAAVRSNHEEFSQAAFETIYQKTGVAEKRIPRSNAFLLNAKLLANIVRNPSQKKVKNPNQYFLLGYRDLFVGRRSEL